MIDVLLQGKVRGSVAVKTGKNGHPYANFRLAAADKNSEGVLCSCITFSKSAIDAVQVLGDGDSIAVSGEASISSWQGKDGTPRTGLDVLVHGVLSAYHNGRKRQGAQHDE